MNAAPTIASRFVHAVIVLLSYIPKACVPCVAWVISGLMPLLGRKEALRLEANADAVLGLRAGTHFARQFARQNRRHQATCMIETLRAIREPASLSVLGVEQLREQIATAEASGLGHVVVTAHAGSWELVAYHGRQAAQRPFHVLAKPSRSAALTAALDALRQKMNVTVLWTDKKSLLRDMLGAFKRGESVGFVMDQKPEARQGPVVQFFGRPTEFVSGPAQMAIRADCAVIAVFCMREGPWRYRLITETIVPPRHAVQDEVALTQSCAAAIERVIRLYPEQWTWGYKRWR